MRTFEACGGVRMHPVHPPWLRAWYIKGFSAIFQQFPIISEDFQRLRKIAEDGRCPETATAPYT